MIETMIWLITGRCNYNCKYCYAKRFKELPELDTYECMRIISEASKLGIRNIAFTGGEPFIRNDIFELVEWSLKCGVKASITTNGSLIDNEKAKRIHDLGIFLYISLDGIGGQHELLRDKGSWATLNRTFNILNEFKTDFATITTLHKLNYIWIKEIIKFCQDLGAKFSCFIPLMTFGNGDSICLDRNEVIHSLQLLNDGTTEYKHPVTIWCMPFAKRFIRPSISLVRIEGCRDTMDINVNGDVLLCDMLDIVIGSVRNEGLDKMVNQTHKVTKQIMHPKLTGKCAECYIKYKCRGGCYARAFAKFGNFNSPDPLCPTVLSASK